MKRTRASLSAGLNSDSEDDNDGVAKVRYAFVQADQEQEATNRFLKRIGQIICSWQFCRAVSHYEAYDDGAYILFLLRLTVRDVRLLCAEEQQSAPLSRVSLFLSRSLSPFARLIVCSPSAGCARVRQSISRYTITHFNGKQWHCGSCCLQDAFIHWIVFDGVHQFNGTSSAQHLSDKSASFAIAHVSFKCLPVWGAERFQR